MNLSLSLNYALAYETLTGSGRRQLKSSKSITEHNLFSTILQQINELSLQDGNASTRRQQLENNLLSVRDQLRDAISSPLALLTWEHDEIGQKRRVFDNAMNEMREEAEAITNQMKKLRDDTQSETQEILAIVRNVATETGVAHHEATFREVADRYAKSAQRWLLGAIGIGLITIGSAFGLVLAWDVTGDLSDASVLQIVAVKLIVLSVGSFFTIQASRIYKSNLHLQVVNHHRAEALKTFRAFVEGTDEPETRRKVLLEACHTVFGQVPTGLISESDKGTLEILDGAMGLLRR